MAWCGSALWHHLSQGVKGNPSGSNENDTHLRQIKWECDMFENGQWVSFPGTAGGQFSGTLDSIYDSPPKP